MALSFYPMNPAGCSHSEFCFGEARCPECGSTRVEVETMGVTERWVDATTFADAAAGIRREVSNLGGERVVDVCVEELMRSTMNPSPGMDSAIREYVHSKDSFYPPLQRVIDSVETFYCIMESGYTGFSIEGKAAPMPASTLAMLGEQHGKSMDPCEYNMERVGPNGYRSAVKMANLDATHPKPFVHHRSLKGNVNVPALAVDDPTGDDVAE